jgi:endonuclease G
MQLFKKLSMLSLIALVVFSSCKKNDEFGIEPPDEIIPTNGAPANATLYEDAETGTKTSYTTANITLSSGLWTLNDALIGTSSSDRKIGLKSIRIRNTGKAEMLFQVSGGVSDVSIKHAKYGSDGNSTWELWVSYDNGATYAKVGSTITTSSTTLSTATFSLNNSGSFRLSIRKVSGGTNRINIDEIAAIGIVPSVPDNDHMLTGNPSGATIDIVNINNYLMPKTYFALSYNKSRAIPNWVSWHVNTSDIGSTPRQDDFRADNTLPTGWYQVGSTSYSGSGFDRGHNCPSADRTSTVAANSATFLMTNMIPQGPRNNQQTWANLENYTRTLVTAGNEVYVIMGSYGSGGTGSNGFATTINLGNIAVPSNIWKVIVVIPNGSNDLSRITNSTRVIAVNTPNNNTLSTDWKTFRVSVRSIETATGYNILSNVPQAIQDVIENVVDNL